MDTRKKQNPVYSSLKGGFAGWVGVNGTNTPSFNSPCWEYIFLYGICKICKNWGHSLTIPGNTYSFHVNTYGKKVKYPFSWHFHFALLKKFPYLFVGWNTIKKYTKEF